MEEIRLQKYLAEAGIASRRKAEEFILQGKVKVNGQVVTELGTKVQPQKDEVKYENNIVQIENKKIYILLNKPIGYVTTVKDQFKRDTVMDLLKDIKTRIVPVGRLDMYTSGALILSNDGEFVNKVTHPSHEVEKTYNVTVRGKITKEESMNHPKKNMLLKALGCTEFIEPDSMIKGFIKGDIILMCTDGLTNMVSEQEIFNILKTNLVDPSKELINKANEKGGLDNITALIIK